MDGDVTIHPYTLLAKRLIEQLTAAERERDVRTEHYQTALDAWTAEIALRKSAESQLTAARKALEESERISANRLQAFEDSTRAKMLLAFKHDKLRDQLAEARKALEEAIQHHASLREMQIVRALEAFRDAVLARAPRRRRRSSHDFP